MNRNSWVNIRGLSIIGVILIHVTASQIVGKDINSIINLISNLLVRFSVPIFLISSGFGLQSKYGNLEKTETRNFYKKRLKVVPEYIFWSVLYFFVLNIGEWNISKFIYGIVTGTTAGHLYFMIVLIICYLIFPLINKFASTTTGLLVFLGISLLGQSVYMLGFTWGRPYIWNWLIYFVLGIYLSSNPVKFKKMMKYSKIIYFTGTILVLVSSFVYLFVFETSMELVTTAMKPTVIIMSVGIVGLFLKYFKTNNKILEVFDDNSLNVFYVHPIFINIGNKLLEIVGIERDNFIFTLIFLVVISCVSLLFSVLFNRIRTKLRGSVS